MFGGNSRKNFCKILHSKCLLLQFKEAETWVWFMQQNWYNTPFVRPVLKEGALASLDECTHMYLKLQYNTQGKYLLFIILCFDKFCKWLIKFGP